MRSGGFNLNYFAHSKKRDEAQNKPIEGCWRVPVAQQFAMLPLQKWSAQDSPFSLRLRLPKSAGSFAIFTAIRRAASFPIGQALPWW